MNHFSLEVIGKERQKKLLREHLEAGATHQKRRKLHLPVAKLFILATTLTLIYFWL